jgi:PKD domain-containing protein
MMLLSDRIVPRGQWRRAARFFTWLMAAGVLFGACQRVALVAPTGTAITLVSTSNVLPVNGSTDITAFLIQGSQATGAGANPATTTTAGSGVPVRNGTVVTFSTTLGRIEPAEAKTDNGRVTVKLFADGHSGTATITAFSGSATKTLAVTVGAAAATRILVSATPQALPFTGGTTTVMAQVQDQQGNALLGVPVTFSTTAGSLASTSGITNEAGLTSTTLTTTAAATVTASSGGATGTLSGTVAITIKPRTTVTITTPSTITASVPMLFSVGVGANTIVTDATISFGDGESQSLGAISSTMNVAHTYGDAGAYTVTVTATDSEGTKTPISTAVVVTPLAVIGTASPTATALGGTVTFTVTTSTGAAIDHYDWDFGDADMPPLKNSPSNVVNRIFKQRGTKTVTVTVFPVKGPPKTIQIQCEIT